MTSTIQPEQFPKRRTEKRSEIIARELVTHVVDQGLEEGVRLPSEREMLESFQVGRSTLRESLRLLETRGVITIQPGRNGGPVVRRPRPGDLGEALTLILQFEQCTLRDVLEAREAIEPTVARLAALRIDSTQLEHLKETIRQMTDDADNKGLARRQNEIFHSTLAEAADSKVLRVLIETLKSVSDGVVAGVRYSSKRTLAVAEAHQRILSALADRDTSGAERAMRDHLAEARDFWRSKYPELYGSPVSWVSTSNTVQTRLD